MKQVAFLLMLFTGIFVNAQTLKFGKVSKKDIEKTSYDNDEGVDAEVLYKMQKINYRLSPEGNTFTMVAEVHEIVKVYNTEALDVANVSVRLYKGGKTDEKVLGLKGITYNMENGAVVKTKMKKDGVFREDINDYWYARKFALPNVKKGSVIEYTYKIESPYYMSLDDIYLQSVYPIKKLYVDIRIPDYYRFKTYLNPHADYTPVISETMLDTEVSYSETVGRGIGTAVTSKDRGSFKLKVKKYLIAKDNVPAFQNEPYITSAANYLAKIKWDLERIRYPNGRGQNFSQNWDEITKDIYKSSSFGGQLSKEFFKDEVATLIDGVTDRNQKMNIIFDHVKSKMKWNDYISIYASNLKKTYKEGEGDVADINLLLVAMLREAGINANPILTSTKDNGIPLFPTRTGFNYVICGVEVQNDVILLDATGEYNMSDVLPKNVINWQGRMVRKDGSSVWVNLEPKTNAKISTMINASISSDMEVKGKIRSSYSGHMARSFRISKNKTAAEDHIKSIEKGKGDIAIENLEVNNGDDLSKNVLRSYEFTLNDAVEEIAGKLYISPLLFLTEDENIFKQDTRKYPIDFQYPYTEKAIVSISIPEGYTVESLPESKTHLIKDEIGGFDFKIVQKGNNLQAIMTKSINYSLIPKDYYAEIKNYFSVLIDKESEKVVLAKQ